MQKLQIAAVVLVLAVVSCIPGQSDGGGLRYNGPTELGIAVAENLPGTNIQYLGKSEDGADVLIGSQRALRKIGDSLNWSGDLLDGVPMELRTRVVWIGEEQLHVLGTVKISVADASPQPGPVNEAAAIRYKLPVDYHVKKDGSIPGTRITYLGQTEQGARLGNIEGYAYRGVGDSIVWKGALRDRVWLELNLRTILISDAALNVAGTAELWIAP